MLGTIRTQRMMIDKVLAPALFLLPQTGHGCVDQSLDGVIQLQLLAKSRPLQLNPALRAKCSSTFDSLQQTRFANWRWTEIHEIIKTHLLKTKDTREKTKTDGGSNK